MILSSALDDYGSIYLVKCLQLEISTQPKSYQPDLFHRPTTTLAAGRTVRRRCRGDPHFNVGGKTCRHHIGPCIAWLTNDCVVLPGSWEISSALYRTNPSTHRPLSDVVSALVLVPAPRSDEAGSLWWMPRGARLVQCRSSDIAEHGAAEREGKTARAIILQQSNQGRAACDLH